jgi:hypothetical protein
MQWVNLPELTNTLVGVLVGALLTGAVILWISSDQTERRKEKIWNAIRKWIELPVTRFRDQMDTLPLAEKPPEYADEINECLKRGYRWIWDSWQKFRQEYFEWKNANVSEKFTKVENGKTIIDLQLVIYYNEKTCNELIQLHSQLVEQIKSEILAKYHTRLKC